MFKLIANTAPVPKGSARDWQRQSASCVRPTQLAFLVFEITAEYDWLEYLAGLYVEYTETGYIVAGTVDRLTSAAEHYSANTYPQDIQKFYGYVKQKIRDFGYEATK